MKKKVSKNVKRRLTVLFPMAIGIFCYAFFIVVSYTYQINNLTQTKKNLEQKLVDLKDNADVMSDEIIKLKDHEYIAKYARENYYYTKNGEYVLKIVKEKEKPKKKKKISIDSYTPFLAIIPIFILLFKKKKKKK